MNTNTIIAFCCIFLLSTPSSWSQETGELDVPKKAPDTPQLLPNPNSQSDKLFSSLQIPWTEPSGTSIGIGYDNGFWGGSWVQSLRFKIPFHEHWSIIARGIFILKDLGLCYLRVPT